MKVLSSLCLALLLVACKPGAAITCPPLKQYSRQFLQSVSQELAVIEVAAPHVVQMIDDYGVERDAIRACIKRRARGQ